MCFRRFSTKSAIDFSTTAKLSYELLIPNTLFSVLHVMALLFSMYCSLSFFQTIYIILPVFLVSVLENHSRLTSVVSCKITDLLRQPDWLNKVLAVDVFMKPFVAFVLSSELHS